ncbi:hypothetical protein F4778DRAFT_799921 [Xylariomycetidae sp. FL2044]|nr:hypothetical protein F4778DRAFT_799921 [Xylariomycetidae sp. FL2044]
MASTVEKTPEGIIYAPSRNLEVPDLDLMTLLFGEDLGRDTGDQRESDMCPVAEDKPIHIDAAEPSDHFSKARLRTWSRKVAHVFRHQYGVGAAGPNRDVAMMIAGGHFMIPLLFYGAIMADGIFSSTSPSATVDEFAYQLKQTEPKVIVCLPETKDVALAAAAKTGLPARNVLVFGGTRDLEFHEAAGGARVPISNQELDWRRITDPKALDDSVICLLFSSGTTGLPKAMRLSHRNSVAATVLTMEPLREFNKTQRPPDFDCISLAHLPPAHIAGVQGYLANVLYMGGACYWMRKFDFPKFCEYVQKYRVTSMFSVPPIYLLIAKSPLVKDQLETWVDVIGGAAPMGHELEAEASRKLGGRVRQTWGLSETSGSFTVVPLELADQAPPGSVGTLVANCYARIVDDDDKDVEPGTPGEIWAKGPIYVTQLAHWNNDDANKEAFKNGWFCTGDIGLFKDGWFFIVDRKKELIKYKGMQVAPAELEAVLLSHPKIIDAAVIGVPGGGTEVPRAYVVANPKQISAKDIVEWFSKQGLAHYKQLRGGVVFIEAIPKSPSGKILRKTLRDMAKKEEVAPKL